MQEESVYASLRRTVATWSSLHPEIALSHASGYLDDSSFCDLVRGIIPFLSSTSEAEVIADVTCRLLHCAQRAGATSTGASTLLVALACTREPDCQAVVLAELQTAAVQGTLTAAVAACLLGAFLPHLNAACGVDVAGVAYTRLWRGEEEAAPLALPSTLLAVCTQLARTSGAGDPPVISFVHLLSRLYVALAEDRGLHGWLKSGHVVSPTEGATSSSQGAPPVELSRAQTMRLVTEQAHFLRALTFACTVLPVVTSNAASLGGAVSLSASSSTKDPSTPVLGSVTAGSAPPFQVWIALATVLCRVGAMLAMKEGELRQGLRSDVAGNATSSPAVKTTVELLVLKDGRWSGDVQAAALDVAMGFLLPDLLSTLLVALSGGAPGKPLAHSKARNDLCAARTAHAIRRMRRVAPRLDLYLLCEALTRDGGCGAALLPVDVLDTVAGLALLKSVHKHTTGATAGVGRGGLCSSSAALLAGACRALCLLRCASALTTVNASAFAPTQVMPDKLVVRLFWKLPTETTSAAIAASTSPSPADWRWQRTNMRTLLLENLGEVAGDLADGSADVADAGEGNTIDDEAPLEPGVMHRLGPFAVMALHLSMGTGAGHVQSMAEGGADKPAPALAVRVIGLLLAAGEAVDAVLLPVMHQGRLDHAGLDDATLPHDNGEESLALLLCSDGELAVGDAALHSALQGFAADRAQPPPSPVCSDSGRGGADGPSTDSLPPSGLLGLLRGGPTPTAHGSVGSSLTPGGRDAIADAPLGATRSSPTIVSIRGLACAALLAGDPTIQQLSHAVAGGGSSSGPDLLDFVLAEGGLVPSLQMAAQRAGFPSLHLPAHVLPDVGRFAGSASEQGRAACWTIVASALARAVNGDGEGREEEGADEDSSGDARGAGEQPLHACAVLVCQVVSALLHQCAPVARLAPWLQDMVGGGVTPRALPTPHTSSTGKRPRPLLGLNEAVDDEEEEEVVGSPRRGSRSGLFGRLRGGGGATHSGEVQVQQEEEEQRGRVAEATERTASEGRTGGHDKPVQMYADEAGEVTVAFLRLLSSAARRVESFIRRRRAHASQITLLPLSDPVCVALAVLQHATSRAQPFSELLGALCDCVRSALHHLSGGGTAGNGGQGGGVRTGKRRGDSGRSTARKQTRTSYTKRTPSSSEDDEEGSAVSWSDASSVCSSASEGVGGGKGRAKGTGAPKRHADSVPSRTMHVAALEVAQALHACSAAVVRLEQALEEPAPLQPAASSTTLPLRDDMRGDGTVRLLPALAAISSGLSRLRVQLSVEVDTAVALLGRAAVEGRKEGGGAVAPRGRWGRGGRGRGSARGGSHTRPATTTPAPVRRPRGRLASGGPTGAGRSTTPAKSAHGRDEEYVPGSGRSKGGAGGARGRGRGRGGSAGGGASAARSRNALVDSWLREPGPEGHEGDASAYADLEDFIVE